MDNNRRTEVSHRALNTVGPQHERDFRKHVTIMIKEEARLRGLVGQTTGHCQRYHNEIWREKVAEWCYNVVDHIGDERDIVYIAMNILDRYISLHSSGRYLTNEKAYKLAAMTALLLALKLFGRTSFGSDLLQKMSKTSVAMEEVTKVEKAMLQSLSWQHRLITPSQFVRVMLKFLPSSVPSATLVSLAEAATFYVELSVCDYVISEYAPSVLAFAAVMNAIDREVVSVSVASTFYEEIKEATGLGLDDVTAVRSRLHHVYSLSLENEQNPDNAFPHVIPSDDVHEPSCAPSAPVVRMVSPHEESPTNLIKDSYSDLVNCDQSQPTQVNKGINNKKRSLPSGALTSQGKRVRE